MSDSEAEKKQPLDAPASQIATMEEIIDEEAKTEKYPYPKSVGFIITNEFCERFSYYGMKAILVFYLKEKLLYSENTATTIYHVFSMFVYFFPIIGAMIADSWLGRFRTIFFLSIVYALGNVLLSVTAIPTLNIPGREITMLGLALVAIGTGGIKPCVSAFGGDQFKMPEQAVQLATFFSLFYFAINCGSLISTFITPILRNDVNCFDDNDCYSLAFGVPGILMVASLIIFLIGKPFYVMKKPAGNILVQVLKTIGHALKRKSKLKKVEKREHWLDYADDRYPKSDINGIKAVLRVLVLFIPLPVFWALFDQQGSRWTFQASRMNGKMGNFILKPDQVQVINPLLILVFIPLFEVAIYPALKWCKLVRKPLHKMIGGGFLACLSFVISAIVELQLETTYPVLPGAGIGHLRIYNGHDCPFVLNLQDLNNTQYQIPAFDAYQIKDFKVKGQQNISYTLQQGGSCDPVKIEGYLTVEEKAAWGVYIRQIGAAISLSTFEDNSDKTLRGIPIIRVLYNDPTAVLKIYRKDTLERTLSPIDMGQHDLETATEYKFELNDKPLLTREMKMGESITFILNSKNGEVQNKQIEITPANSIHILWLIPQYVIITMGEVMFSVTGLEFSFTQAPATMKSVLTAGWLLTVAFGNLIVVIVAEIQAFSSQAHEFFLFAGLMFVDMLIFWFMTLKYVYVEHENNDSSTNEPEDATPEKLGLENMAYSDTIDEKKN